MTEGDIATCPKCGEYMVDGYNCSPFSTSIESEKIAEKDSGKLLAAATEEDSTLEKQPLPDPQKSQIPLSTKSPEDKHSTSLRKMFKRVFGSGGGK
jgi:hypothetical protein